MKYKVGDKVIITHCGHDHGKTGVITKILGDEHPNYQVLGWWHNSGDCFSLVETGLEPPEPDEEPVPAHLMIRKIQRAKEE